MVFNDFVNLDTINMMDYIFAFDIREVCRSEHYIIGAL